MTIPQGGMQSAPTLGRFQLLLVASSADGISGLGHLLGGLPAGFDIPVVIVQHLRPQHETEIDAVLTRRGELPVKLAEHEEKAKPGTVYVAPPDRTLRIDSDDTFTLTEHVHKVHPSADPVFQAAAEAYGPGAIACVLSGLGDDGALGASAIKERGGIVIVQDPRSAEFRAMPDAALEAADADYVVPLAEIAPLVCRLVEERRA